MPRDGWLERPRPHLRGEPHALDSFFDPLPQDEPARREGESRALVPLAAVGANGMLTRIFMTVTADGGHPVREADVIRTLAADAW